jgi:hypothetical protein
MVAIQEAIQVSLCHHNTASSKKLEKESERNSLVIGAVFILDAFVEACTTVYNFLNFGALLVALYMNTFMYYGSDTCPVAAPGYLVKVSDSLGSRNLKYT